MVSKASELLPEPDRPVSTTSFSRGRSREMFLRLCSRAPRMEMNLEVILHAMSGQGGRSASPAKAQSPTGCAARVGRARFSRLARLRLFRLFHDGMMLPLQRH